jgi:hypothetical protein
LEKMVSQISDTNRRTLAIALITAGIAGCAQLEWTKAGGTQDELSRVRYQCLQESQQRAAASKSVGNAYGAYQSASVDKTITNESLFRACMNSQGWYLTSSQQAAPQPAPSAPAQAAPAAPSVTKAADQPKKATSKAQPKTPSPSQQKSTE